MDAIRMDTGIFSVVTADRDSVVIRMDELLATPGAFSEEDYRKRGL